VTGQAITVRLARTGTVTFWKMQNDPSKGTRTVAATAATKLVEEWHP
jgi:hypothetical protein